MPNQTIELTGARVTIETDEVSIEMDSVSGSFSFTTTIEDLYIHQSGFSRHVQPIISEQSAVFEGVCLDLESIIIGKKEPLEISPEGQRVIRVEKDISGSGEKP